VNEGFARLHADARAILAAWDHPEPGQRAMREEYLAFLARHPDAMSRECRVGHLTSSALVLDEHRTRVLLTLHPKAGRWLQLGGHCEEGDGTLRAAAIRETIEEGGIPDVTMSAMPIRIDRHPVMCAGEPTEHLDVEYLAIVPAGAQAVMSEESDDLRWWDVGDLPPDLDQALSLMIRTALSP